MVAKTSGLKAVLHVYVIRYQNFNFSKLRDTCRRFGYFFGPDFPSGLKIFTSKNIRVNLESDKPFAFVVDLLSPSNCIVNELSESVADYVVTHVGISAFGTAQDIRQSKLFYARTYTGDVIWFPSIAQCKAVPEF